MYLNLGAISEALERLRLVHVFYGTSFLVFKRGQLPVGSMTDFPINSTLRNFMEEYYKPFSNSERYYRVFRHVQKDNHWLVKNWPSTSAQSTMTRDFISAFLHEPNTSLWGWDFDYVSALKHKAPRNSTMPVPAFHLAVWLYRNRQWRDNIRSQQVLQTFLDEFHITPEEQVELFDTSVPEGDLFSSIAVSEAQLATIIQAPPDAPQDEGGTLAYLELQGIGPSTRMVFSPAERLNLITGDNGLGKSFLLECAWWALTGEWAGLSAYPREDTRTKKAQISFRIASTRIEGKPTTIRYDWSGQRWPIPAKRPTIPGLLIYARVDGSFAVFDPAQAYLLTSASMLQSTIPSSIVLTRDQLWNGHETLIEGQVRSVINGLIRDVVLWQYNPSRSPLSLLQRVLDCLSPRETGPLSLGQPVRLPFDRREVPTLTMPYGPVPVVHAAAGMQRILALAYLIVWAWTEHRTQSDLARRMSQSRMVIMVDEVEAHLHPQWQRLILPALLEVQQELGSELQVQYLITTHSPLITASVEPFFERDRDALFHLDLVKQDLLHSDVNLNEVPFVRHGSVDAWLTADDVFSLEMARSIEAEGAIKQAKALQLLGSRAREGEVARVSQLLSKFLAAEDEFWPRWTYFAEQHGVKL